MDVGQDGDPQSGERRRPAGQREARLVDDQPVGLDHDAPHGEREQRQHGRRERRDPDPHAHHA
jgi:hypothetical protein